METPERPLFANVGRRVHSPGAGRSSAVLLVVAVGLLAAMVAFLAEQAARPPHLRIVEVTLMGAEAASAEAEMLERSAGP